jgi:hypothetical protein
LKLLNALLFLNYCLCPTSCKRCWESLHCLRTNVKLQNLAWRLPHQHSCSSSPFLSWNNYISEHTLWVCSSCKLSKLWLHPHHILLMFQELIQFSTFSVSLYLPPRCLFLNWSPVAHITYPYWTFVTLFHVFVNFHLGKSSSLNCIVIPQGQESWSVLSCIVLGYSTFYRKDD